MTGLVHLHLSTAVTTSSRVRGLLSGEGAPAEGLGLDKKGRSARLVQSELGCQEPGLPCLALNHTLLAQAHTASLSLCQLSDGHRAHGLNPEGLRGMTEASLHEAFVTRHTSTQ